MWMRRILRIVLLVAIVSVPAVVEAPPAVAFPGAPWFEPGKPYSDNFPDPSVVVHDGRYYAYGTSTGGAYLPVMTSTDMRTWVARPRYEQPDCVPGPRDPYFNDALPCPAAWAPDRPGVEGRLKKELWAPGAARIGGRFVVFYSVLARVSPERYCISVATSSSPLGPFVDLSSGPLVCDSDPKGSIDPQPFVDSDGTPYLLWKSEGVPGSTPTRIWVRRLAPDGTSFAPGTQQTELLRTSQGWEGNVIENPSMARWAGNLYLFYSANEWRSTSYATGYATCASVLGPCSKWSGNPVLATRGNRYGPGGPAAFVDLTGQLQLGYHYWDGTAASYPQNQRRFAVEPVHRGQAGLRVGGAPPPSPIPRTIDRACPPHRVREGWFTDVSPTSPHARPIDCVAHWGVAEGRGDRTYAPGAVVTRGQMATFIARLIERSGGTLPEHPRNHFSDDEGSPHERAINQLADVGVVAGTGEGRFSPHRAVTRDQMATFLIRAHGYRTGQLVGATRDWFWDDNGSVHEDNINRAASAGLTGGLADGTYRPGGAVRRDQMASFLARTLDLLVEQGHATVP